jgi:hypothetical protein
MKIRSFRAGVTALALTVSLTSCIAMVFARLPHKVPFDEAEFAPYRAPGTGAIHGQLVANFEGKDYLAYGSPVTLLPVTAYTQEMIDRELGDGVTLLPSDSRLKKYIRIGRTDHQGNFTIGQLPAGEYFVAGEISWYHTADDDYTQWACERVKVGKGQTVQIKVTHNPQRGNVINNIWTVE